MPKTDYQGNLSVTAVELTDITQARIDYAKYVLIRIRENVLNEEITEQIMNILEKHRSNDFSVKMCYYSSKCCVMMNTPQTYGVLPSDEFLDDLRMVIGKDNVSIQF